jgi:hypothetical protein
MAKLSPWTRNYTAVEFVPGAEHAEAFAAWSSANTDRSAWSAMYDTPAGRAFLDARTAHFAAEHALHFRRVRLTHTDQARTPVAFGVVDRLGREIGARAFAERVTVEEVTADDQAGRITSWPRDMRLGDFFTYTPHATRNGSSYGASQSAVWFDTEAERDRGVEKYLDSARKRASKTAAA